MGHLAREVGKTMKKEQFCPLRVGLFVVLFGFVLVGCGFFCGWWCVFVFS